MMIRRFRLRRKAINEGDRVREPSARMPAPPRSAKAAWARTLMLPSLEATQARACRR